MSPILLPAEFKYITAPLVSLGWVLLWQGILVGRARRRAGIAYPQLYAEQAECKANPAALKFNCTQRAHQNTLEFVPTVVLGTLITGLNHPLLATALSGTFSIGRVLYTYGYKTGDPAKRTPGAMISNAATIGLLLSATYTVFQLFQSV
ncbi:hypothetical protein EDD16DRAFT_1898785 [Pisolithus croceorrhizus]|nr:hypothetical protein EDD16DRAFT_1898785 [Pisolithus croceorrhizus]KAI6118963.1 hypothetical protein EV401DRAFT_1965068 [Pisolithus croceorrhizus]KAI6144529.1 hypothetical protein EDD17DRAFT_1657127 [Pisolithus thermaeus]